MTLPVADRWFESTSFDDGVTLFWEPHVIPLMRCNIWHVKGRDRDLVIDTGMGVGSLTEAMASVIDKPVSAVATHGHGDHIGSHHEFDDVLIHPEERGALEKPDLSSLNILEAWGTEGVEELQNSGYEVNDQFFVSALPAGYVLESFIQKPAKITRLIDEGDVVDTGDRQFEVLHLPGHSPGSIGLWEQATETLFSGDAIYDGPLLDELAGSDIAAYCRTMERLIELPARVVHAGHDPSFGRDRLRTLAREYLERRM